MIAQAVLLGLLASGGADPSPADEPSAVVYRFSEPRPYLAAVLPAVVIVLEESAPVPDEITRRGEHLGGPSYLLPTRDPIGDARRWARHPAVRAADPDFLLPVRRRQTFDDPQYGGQWYVEDLGMEELWEVSLGDPSTLVAVADSGTEIEHPDLVGAVVAPYDAVDEDPDPSPNPGEYCQPGDEGLCDVHGTAVSGIVAARANNGVGIVGLCPACSLVPIKLLGEAGSPLSADVRAFEHAIAQDVAVINNSWGFTVSMPAPATLADAIHRAATETRGGLGSLVVFAAGNDDREIRDDEVEALPDVLCVSAVDSYGNPTAYTNRGAAIDLAAPSATVTLSVGGGTTTTFGGTSAAAPVASGVAAWAASVDPTLSAAQLADLLVSTARPSPLVTPDENGHHDVYGFGLLDARAILERLVPSPDPDAGAGPDPAPDAGSDADAGGDARAGAAGEPPHPGCGCRLAGAGGAGGSWAAVAAFAGGLFGWRRRRPAARWPGQGGRQRSTTCKPSFPAATKALGRETATSVAPGTETAVASSGWRGSDMSTT